MNKRIRLAGARGWTKHEALTDPQVWNHPDPEKDGWYYDWQLPDPFTDANDCNALIKHLNGLGWIVRISIGPDAADVWIETLANECHDWSGDNWMHGVCELALKVIDEKGQ